MTAWCAASNFTTASCGFSATATAFLYTSATVQILKLHTALIFTAVMQNHSDSRKSRHTTKIAVKTTVIVSDYVIIPFSRYRVIKLENSLFSPLHPCLTTPHRGTSHCQCPTFLPPIVSSFKFFAVGAKRRIFAAISLECVSAVQGHIRSMILVPIESAYATSY